VAPYKCVDTSQGLFLTGSFGHTVNYLIDITERPATVELRAQAGHWEVDTVLSRQSKACVAVPVERKSRFIVIRMKDKTASAMHKAVTLALTGLPAGLRKTLTYDNGLENAEHFAGLVR
jgi:IS30 family transposase